MKIKMITLMAGPVEVRLPGKVYDVPAREANALVQGGYATLVDPPPAAQAEDAAPVAVETPVPAAPVVEEATRKTSARKAVKKESKKG